MKSVMPRRLSALGLSLIELLVSMTIALVVTLAITTVMIQGEGSKRSTTSVNEINQAGAYIAYVMDRQLSSAGSGYAQRWGDTFGCAVNAARNNAALLPRATAFPTPFANAPQVLRLAPVIIQADGANTTGTGAEVRGDLITMLAGTAGYSESPPLVQTGSVTGASGGGSLQLPNSLGFSAGDLVLLADTGVPGGCLLEQVSSVGTGGVLQLGGLYYLQTGGTASLGNFGANTYATQLGNVSSSPANPPMFTMFGVGDQRTLYSYDLLSTAATDAPPVPIADGVVEMRALYGLDTSPIPDGTVDSWVLPDAANYTAAALTDGSASAKIKLRQIVAIKIGFILRTSLKEKDPIAANSTLTLFGDLDDSSLHRTRTLTGDELYYRFRTVEVTVPLRNVLLAPQSAS